MAIIEKGCYRGNIVEEPTRGSGLNGPIAIAIKGQPIGCLYHTTFADQATELGRHEEEGLGVGNHKFQLP